MLGARISALRKLKDMSQGELARQLGVSSSAVGMYEQGRREPGILLLIRLGEIFHITVDFLLTGHPITENDKRMMERILFSSIRSAREQLDLRRDPNLTEQELATVIAAMLAEA